MSEKNEYFGKIEYQNLTQEMKDKGLPLIIFMATNRNGDIESRGVANGRLQRQCAKKSGCRSPTPYFYDFKYVCAMIAKEDQDIATIDLKGFFLQTEMKGDVPLLLKLTGSVALLLVK